MNRERSWGTGRFAASALIALPITVALLFLMTRLIVPSDHDPIVTRMIRDIEFQRTVRSIEPANSQTYMPSRSSNDEPMLIKPILLFARSENSSDPEERPTENLNADRVRVTDWWAEARRIARESDDATLQRWFLEQGHEKYASIMQGPLPITNSVYGTPAETQEDITGYLNTFGDMEIKISENCVAQTQVSGRLDISDFAEKLPMRIACKRRKKVHYSFDRDAD